MKWNDPKLFNDSVLLMCIVFASMKKQSENTVSRFKSVQQLLYLLKIEQRSLSSKRQERRRPVSGRRLWTES